MPISDKKSKEPGLSATDVEFDAVLSDGGVIELPAGVAEALASARGLRVRVRVRALDLASGLLARGVTDEEILRIASVQSEEREAVVRFLLSEGGLQRAPRGGSR